MKKRTVTTLAAVALLAPLLMGASGGCGSSSGGGSSKPAPAPSYSSIFPPDTPAPGSDSQPKPVASADAFSGHNPDMECHDYFAAPTGITITAYNVMAFGVTIFCTVPPTGQVTTVTLQLWSSGQWTNYHTQVHYTIPGPKPVLFGGISPSCFPGLWRVSYFILASQYGHVFYQPAKGTRIYSAPRRITKSECS